MILTNNQQQKAENTGDASMRNMPAALRLGTLEDGGYLALLGNLFQDWFNRFRQRYSKDHVVFF